MAVLPTLKNFELMIIDEKVQLEFLGFVLDTISKTSSRRFREAVVTNTFSKGEGVNKSSILKFNGAASKKLDLILSDEDIAVNRAIEDEIDGYRPSQKELDKLSSFEKKALAGRISKAREKKKFKTVTFFKSKNASGQDIICLINSTEVGNAVPENMKQRVSASSYTVKLKLDEVKRLYEMNELPLGDDFKDAEDMVFELNMSKTKIGDTEVDSCYLVKLQKAIVVVKDPEAPKKDRSVLQDALSDKMYDWFEAERLAGRTPSPRLYWKAHPEEKKAVA